MPVVPKRCPPLDLTPGTVLYRRVNRNMHEERHGLRPRNAAKLFTRQVFCDGSWMFDGSAIYGPPHSQAVHALQWNSEGFNGPGLSFTIFEKVARRFATTGGLEDGSSTP